MDWVSIYTCHSIVFLIGYLEQTLWERIYAKFLVRKVIVDSMSQGTLLVWIENCKMYRKDWMEWISFMFFMDAIMMTLLLATDFVNRTCQKVGTWKILGNLVSHFLMHQFNLCNESKQDFFLQSLRLMISFGDVIWYSISS